VTEPSHVKGDYNWRRTRLLCKWNSN